MKVGDLGNLNRIPHEPYPKVWELSMASIAHLRRATWSSWEGRGTVPATKEGFMCWSPPIHTIQSTSFTNLVLALRPCVRLDQRFPVAVTQRYSLLRPIVALTLTRCYSPPSCTTFQLHESSHQVLRSSFGLFHASLAPLTRPKTNQIYLILTI